MQRDREEKNDVGISDTLKQRGNRYGDFKNHAELTQTLEGIVFSHALTHGSGLSMTQKEALHMILHKIARIANGDPNYADSWHDIAGYATLAEEEIKKGDKC